MADVLVTDGRTLSALAVVRSLGRRGLAVHVGDEFPSTITSYSTHVESNVVYPSAGNSPTRFIEEVVERANEEAYDLIIPVRDETTLLLSKHRSELPAGTDVVVADHSTIEQLLDKEETMKLARRHGVSIPPTYYPSEEGIETVRDVLEYPVLIKPRRSSGSRGIQYAHSKSELLQRYEAVSEEYDDPIVQEYISHEGGHYSIGTLFDRESNPVALHVYKETKQYPPSGGPAATATSVAPDDWVWEMIELLERVNWVGPAHMDVLFDPETAEYRLLEVNPRLWMSLNLTVQSGVDVPHLLYRLATEGSVDPVRRYTAGLDYRWVFPNELLWVLAQDRKASAVREFLRFTGRRTCYGVVSRDDPLPLVGVAAQSLRFLTDPEKRAAIFERGW